jgi:crotonobetainyl-CoA:carnitine CoA-transferase CaiB-like acyl-CoA transferase
LLPIHLTDGEAAGTATTLPRLPVEFGHRKPALHRDLPSVGAHNHEVLTELGIEDKAIAALVAEGVLSG